MKTNENLSEDQKVYQAKISKMVDGEVIAKIIKQALDMTIEQLKEEKQCQI